MNAVGIIGESGAEIAQAFMQMSSGEASCCHITANPQVSPKINVLVASDASPVVSAVAPQLTGDDFLVVNADDKGIFPLLGNSSAKLITYGFNSRACITASSVTNDGVQVCIQRGFIGADGVAREPQEFPARAGTCENSMAVLGAAAAWSVLKHA